MEPKCLSLTEAAKVLGVPDTSKDPGRVVRRMIERGELRGLRVGRYLVVPMGSIDEFLRAK